MRMRFGRGLDDLREPLRSAVEVEWRVRFEPVPPSQNDIPDNVRVMVAEIISTGDRALVKVHHPDAGGATRTMQLLNNAVAWLRAQARTTER